MLSNLKIGIRLSIGFALTLCLLIAVALIGISRVGDLQHEISDLVNDKNLKVKLANDVIDNVQGVGRFHRNMLIGKSDETTSVEMAKIVEARATVSKAFDALEKLSYGDQGKAAIDAAKEARRIFVAASLKLEEQAKGRQWDEAVKHFNSDYRPAFNAFMKTVDHFITYQTELAEKSGKEAEALAASSRTLIIGLAAAAVLIGLLLAYLITRSITGPTGKLVAATTRMADGDFDFKIDIDSQDEVGQLAKGVQATQASVQRMIADADLLTKAAVDGRLATRADATKHQGDFRKVVEGVNETLDAVIGPLNVTASYVDQIARGIIPPVISDSYNGDFNTIKTNLNAVVKMMSELLAQTDLIIRAAADGELDKRANASLFVGGWNQLVSGVNDTISNIVNPLNVTAAYVDRISRGDIPPKITDAYRGDYNIIKNNLNACVEAVNALVADATMLSAAAVAGKLETRADPARHQGDFRKIVAGVNETLDNVVEPINEVRRIMGAMAGGDLTQTISTTYRGDFDELKNAINQTVGKLVETIGEVRTAADNLSNASGQISATAQSLSQSSSEQAASVEETTSSMEQMSASIMQNTENAKVTDGMASARRAPGGRGRRRGRPDGRSDEVDRRKDRHHRRHRLPDQPARPERRDRGGARRRTRQGLRRRRRRSEKARRALAGRRAGDRQRRQGFGEARRTRRRPADRDGAVDQEDLRTGAGHHRRLARAEFGRRPDQRRHGPAQPGDAAERVGVRGTRGDSGRNGQPGGAAAGADDLLRARRQRPADGEEGRRRPPAGRQRSGAARQEPHRRSAPAAADAGLRALLRGRPP
jgi:methyl-accepting chemotaxis protein